MLLGPAFLAQIRAEKHAIVTSTYSENHFAAYAVQGTMTDNTASKARLHRPPAVLVHEANKMVAPNPFARHPPLSARKASAPHPQAWIPKNTKSYIPMFCRRKELESITSAGSDDFGGGMNE